MDDLGETLFCGDNLEVLRRFPSESVDLIATDPPFNTGRDFKGSSDSRAADAAFRDRWYWLPLHDGWLKDLPAEAADVVRLSRRIHGDGMGAFLCFMGIRLVEMRRVLKATGSIYLHCDTTASHYLRLLLDSVFGRRNFRNVIVWMRSAGRAKGSQFGPRKFGEDNDSILLSVKDCTRATFNGSYESMPLGQQLTEFPYTDKAGRYKTTVPLFREHSATARPGLCYEYKGIRNPYPSGWRVSKEKLAEMDAAGEIIWRPGKKPLRKTYLHRYKGKPRGTAWVDIPNITAGQEKTGYPTQKPVALYERLIEASSNEGDQVLDPFCGSGTALVAAVRLNRRWAGIDASEEALKVSVIRLCGEGLLAPDGEAPEGKLLLKNSRIRYSREPL